MCDFEAIDQFCSSCPRTTQEMIVALHQIAVKHDCQFKTDHDEQGFSISYSLRSFMLRWADGKLWMDGEYDIRAFMDLYRNTDDEAVKRLLFHAAIPCEYCINDKCTTYLMAAQRTIQFEGRQKKLCAPWRHHLHIEVTPNTLSACRAIAEMMFAYAYPHMHVKQETQNDVSYVLNHKEDFYIVGYRAVHNQFTVSDDVFAASILKRNDDGQRKLDALFESTQMVDTGCYVGAIDNFVNGVLYDYVFGIICDHVPDALPDGVVCRRIRSGAWAVYNSSTGDYQSIWRHFTSSFYDAEKMGYDTARIPFELHTPDGRIHDVHIPVDPLMGKESSTTKVLVHTPNIKLAGFTNYIENDHPLHHEYTFAPEARLKELFPYADKIVNTSIHAIFGKPMRYMFGVEIDDLTPVPEGLETYELQGGYWHVEGSRHFNGGAANWDFDDFYDSLQAKDNLAHPRAFSTYEYQARGGYTEVVVPVRVRGERHGEVVDLPAQYIIGKLEAPPDSIVTDEDIHTMYNLPANGQQGTYFIAYTLAVTNQKLYFDKPIIKGITADMAVELPSGYQSFILDAGRYLKITESVPLGEPGWEIECFDNEEYTTVMGYAADRNRQFIIRQYGYGYSYELYVPIFDDGHMVR